MATLAPFFAPSKDTIEGINARTGMNLPDLPYGGILSLLTGGASGLGQYALGQMLEQNVPKLVSAIDPTVGSGLRNAGDMLQGDVQDYRETMLDKIFGAVPQTGPAGPTGISTYPQTGWEGAAYDPDSMQYGMYSAPDTTTSASYLQSILGDQYSGGLPSFEMPNIGMDFEQMPDFNQFDFQDFTPSFDYTDFDFRKGGKV